MLEIGAGTGVIPTALFTNSNWASPSEMPLNWIATDQAELLPLLCKNLRDVHSSAVNIHVAEYDWVYLHSSTQRLRQEYIESLLRPFSRDALTYPDLVLCVDCVYNPSLFPALVDAIKVICSSNTAVVIAVQLRAFDTIQEFLAEWLGTGEFHVFSVEDDALPPEYRQGYAIWIAWRT